MIIAEAGVNSNGSLDIAYKMVDAAKEAGVDIVKFQTANPDKLTSKFAKMANIRRSIPEKKNFRRICSKI